MGCKRKCRAGAHAALPVRWLATNCEQKKEQGQFHQKGGYDSPHHFSWKEEQRLLTWVALAL